MADFSHEAHLQKQGFRCIAGLDEVGRGCLAGPVVAGAVVFRADTIPEGIKDSKELSAPQRERLAKEIEKSALAHSVAFATVEEIDRFNILNASKLAMVRAVEKLSCPVDYLLIDGNFAIQHALPQRSLISGDRISVSIAAASILAKVFRDRWMQEFEDLYPGYLFAKNKGYGSEAHRRALGEKGPCAIHRKSFSWTPL